MAEVDWRYMDALQVLDSFVPETPERRRERARALFMSMNDQLTDQERRILTARQASSLYPNPTDSAGSLGQVDTDPNAALDRMTQEALRLIGEAKNSLGALVQSLGDEEKAVKEAEKNKAAGTERRGDDVMRDIVSKTVNKIADARGMTAVIGPKRSRPRR